MTMGLEPGAAACFRAKAAGAASAMTTLGEPVIGLTHGGPRKGGQRSPTAIRASRIKLPARADEARESGGAAAMQQVPIGLRSWASGSTRIGLPRTELISRCSDI